MSYAYDQYLAEHIGNVNKGLHWMLDNLGFKEEKTALEEAMVSFNHDESKYSTEEYDAYDQYFYGGNRSYKVVQDFNYAWLHHIHQNPHHWQYWVLLEDDPESGMPYKALEIPMPYIFEMIADWWSFSWKSGNLFEIFNWYAAHRNYQYIHPASRRIIEAILKNIWRVLIMQETVAGHDISEIEKQYKRFWAEQEDVINKMVELGHPNVLTAQEMESLVKHSDSEPIGKVIGVVESENGLEATVEHSGIKGQKWGVRRFQNYDGTLTEAGRERYGKALVDTYKKYDEQKKKESGKSKVSSDPKSNKYSRESTKLRQDILKSSKETREILNKVKKLDLENDDDYDKAIDLAQDFKKAARKTYESVLQAYGDSSIKMPSSNYKMLDILTDKAGYDDYYDLIWQNYDEKYEPPKHTRQELSKAINDMDKELKALKADKNADPEYIELIKLEREATQEELDLMHSDISEDDEDLYGIPELKKFPMPDKKHVKSAIRFFNYVDPKYEKELAKAIIEKAEEFGLVFDKDITVGEDNRLKKYLPKKKDESQK